MTRDEFCQFHWEYYLVLEKDFLNIERFISFQLGDNFLYDNHVVADYENSLCFSNEFIKQYQAICSEVDVISKSICKELNVASDAETMPRYTTEILQQWNNIPQQKVKFKHYELQPFMNWEKDPNYHSPNWWSPYNSVKHDRIEEYKSANLKNTLNALAGLYILEQYFVKLIGNRDNTIDVPNDISNLFEMIDFTTKHTVIGKESYLCTQDDIEALF